MNESIESRTQLIIRVMRDYATGQFPAAELAHRYGIKKANIYQWAQSVGIKRNERFRLNWDHIKNELADAIELSERRLHPAPEPLNEPGV